MAVNESSDEVPDDEDLRDDQERGTREEEDEEEDEEDAIEGWTANDADADEARELADKLARIQINVDRLLQRSRSREKPPGHVLEVVDSDNEEEDADDDDDDEEEEESMEDEDEGDDEDVDDEDDEISDDCDEEEQVPHAPEAMQQPRLGPRPAANNEAEVEDGSQTVFSNHKQQMHALVSPFGLEPTIWFEYPAWLGIQRSKTAEHITIQPVSAQAQAQDPSACRWRSYWERKCLKDVFQAAGMHGGRGEKRRTAVVWTKHAKKWKALRASQRHNHFAGSWTIGRKDRLAFTINRKKREMGSDAFGFLPETYILPLHSARLRQVLSAPQARRQTWIRKPLASSQGRGIRVLSHQAAVDVVKNVGKRKGAASKKASSSRGCVIQRYIDHPLLIDRYKFDIRLYVLVTGYDPLRIYLFPEGLVRFCTQPYSNSVASKKNQFRHLTNYSINKKSDRFEHNQDAEDDAVGSKWSLSAWYRYMETAHGKEATEKIRVDMQAVIVKTLIAADDDINQKMASLVPAHETCFELFGFDLMLDRDLRTWLVEVNISPSLMTASPLDKKVKTMLVCDALHLVGIPAPAATAPTDSSAKSHVAAAAGKQPREGRRLKASRNVLGLASKPWPALPGADKKLVQRVAGERLRRGNFQRIFPPLNDPEAHEAYMRLFSSRRYNNVLVQLFERAALKELSAASRLQAAVGLAQGPGFRHARNRAASAKQRNPAQTAVSRVPSAFIAEPCSS